MTARFGIACAAVDNAIKTVQPAHVGAHAGGEVMIIVGVLYAAYQREAVG